MAAPIFAVLIVLLIIICAEFLWRSKQISAELSRKLVHISVGSFAAFWPLTMSWLSIAYIGLAFLVVVGISGKFKILRSIHSINRDSWGEVLFAVTIILLALSIRETWVFAAAMLYMGLADGVAAVVGTKYGKINYYILSQQKTLEGSIAFFVTSFLITFFTVVVWGGLGSTILIWLPLLLTIVENLAVQGTDNFFVPVLAALILSLL